MLTANEIRRQYLEFFKSKGHLIVPSAPIVVKNDPTLLFTNAGMNQFKDYFLGNKETTDTRVADTQKCLRVSGKHNDLEEVGVDTYHHTMFEMLGNWSFGDYFKKEAIEWSWELLTEVYKIPKDQLYVTVFEGDAKENLPKDEEAYNEWKKYIAEDRILLGNKKDNFWEMGDTGPCGPCSEIHVDCRTAEERKATDGSKLVNADHPQVIEIWNNVFMQFNRLKDGSLQPLPAKHVDTGMGLERLVRVLQGKQSNYDTDLFSGTIETIEKITGKKYTNTDSKQDIAFRVLSDHIRAIGFTIADGQLPAGKGAGYVIRRILRRAVFYYYKFLEYPQPLLHQLMVTLAEQFKEVFPELYKQLDSVKTIVKDEEIAFLTTIDKGIRRIENLPTTYWREKADTIYGNQYDLEDDSKANFIHAEKNKFISGQLSTNAPIAISGKIAFELSDTFGFPIDLTELIAREKGWSVDILGFNEELKKQKERSRAATSLDTYDWIYPQGESFIATHKFDSTTFTGYESLEETTRLLKYRKVKQKTNEYYQLVFERTPFYAESGGQVGDTGIIMSGSEYVKIIDTKKENDLIVHFTELLPETIADKIFVKVDDDRRKKISLHHTATHLLHAALRSILGEHVSQKGSLVNDNHLRFDFSHGHKVTDEQIRLIEAVVNKKIREDIQVIIREMPKEDAIALGATALFGEKYANTVRVVTIDPNYSIELCGGTHIGATGELGFFKIKHESAVAAGVRRIEAISGGAAEHYINEQLHLLHSVQVALKNAKDPLKAIEKLYEEKAQLEKHLESLEARQLVAIRNEVLTKDEIINQVTFVGDTVELSSADGLKKLCTDLKHHLDNHVIVLCANIDGKPFVAVAVADTVTAAKGLDAGKIIKEHVAPLIKGGGGGSKALATAGGQDVAGLKNVIETIKGLL